MAMRRLLVSCRYCQRPVAFEPTIGNRALPRLQAHLITCRPDVALGAAASFGEILRYFRVEHARRDAETPRRRLRVGGP